MDDFPPLDKTWLTYVPQHLSPEELRELERKVLSDPEIVLKTRRLFESLGISFDGTDLDGSIARLLENARTADVAMRLQMLLVGKDIGLVREGLDN